MPRKKKKTRRRAAKKTAGGRGRPSRLASASLADLQAEIHRRHSALQARRDELAAEIEAIDLEIGGAPAAPRRGRPRKAAAAAAPARRRGRPAGKRGPGRPPGKKAAKRTRRGRGGGLSLVDSLHKVLQGRTLSVSEVSDAVQKAGYKTKSANFRTIVNQALTANPSRFKKVARGQYTAK